MTNRRDVKYTRFDIGREGYGVVDPDLHGEGERTFYVNGYFPGLDYGVTHRDTLAEGMDGVTAKLLVEALEAKIEQPEESDGKTFFSVAQLVASCDPLRPLGRIIEICDELETILEDTGHSPEFSGTRNYLALTFRSVLLWDSEGTYRDDRDYLGEELDDEPTVEHCLEILKREYTSWQQITDLACRELEQRSENGSKDEG